MEGADKGKYGASVCKTKYTNSCKQIMYVCVCKFFKNITSFPCVVGHVNMNGYMLLQIIMNGSTSTDIGLQ